MSMTETDGDRSLITRVLQNMSDQMSGVTPTDVGALVPTDEFLPPMVEDEPDDPMDPEQLATEEYDPTAVTSSTGRYAWGGYQNGRIPTKALKPIGQGSHRLEPSAADAWIAMRAAAAADGITLKLTDSYRSYDAQVSVRKRKGHQVATAKPGTSVHGHAKAVDADVSDPETLAWLRRNAPRFGWVNPAWAQRKGKSFEPWHYEHVGNEG